MERNWNGTKNWRLERNWNGTKKLETGTELERNEKIGDWNGTGTEQKIWSEQISGTER